MVITLDYETQIHYAMAFNLDVKLTTKQDNITVNVHYIDNLNKQIRAKNNNDDLFYIGFDEILDIEVMD